MPSCCVISCTKKRNVQLLRLPAGIANNDRRKYWQSLIGREDLTENSRICKAHFSEKQFELMRKDGLRKLRPYAIPDLLQKELCLAVSASEENNTTSGLANGTSSEHESSTNVDNIDNMDDNLSPEMENLLTKKPTEEKQQKLIENLRKSLRKALHDRNKYKKQLESTVEHLNKFLNEDQIQCLKTGSARGQLWSENTITKAMKLYRAYGTKRYEEIRRQKFPYPSSRTLQYRLRNIKFGSGILDRVAINPKCIKRTIQIKKKNKTRTKKKENIIELTDVNMLIVHHTQAAELKSGLAARKTDMNTPHL